MELFLNLAWLVLAFVSLAGLSFSRLIRRSKGIRPTQSFLTVSCMMALLFPIVSASDDLYAVARLIGEDANAELYNGKHNVSSPWSVSSNGSLLFVNVGSRPPIGLNDSSDDQLTDLRLVFSYLLYLPVETGRAPPHGKSVVSVASLIKPRTIGLDFLPPHSFRRKIRIECSSISALQQRSKMAFGGLDERDNSERARSSPNSRG